MNTDLCAVGKPSLDASHLEDLKLAASNMLGVQRRAFEAAMALKYCGGSARQGELVFGWNRHTIELGLAEKRTGVACLGAQEAFCGNKRWEEKQPEVARALLGLAASHAQQDPSFRTTLAYTRLSAKEALKQLSEQGFAQDALPCPSTMAQVLNRNGYRLRAVVKAKPQKKFRKPRPSSTTCAKRAGKARSVAASSA